MTYLEKLMKKVICYDLLEKGVCTFTNRVSPDKQDCDKCYWNWRKNHE